MSFVRHFSRGFVVVRAVSNGTLSAAPTGRGARNGRSEMKHRNLLVSERTVSSFGRKSNKLRGISLEQQFARGNTSVLMTGELRKLIGFLVVSASLSYATVAGAGDVFVVPLKGEVSEAQFFFLRRSLKEAERQGASAFVIEMDTYGGELKAATRMLEALFKTAIPTVTYINTNAGSAGALVALSTKKIFMAPVSAIGAAAPVMVGGENLPSTMNDKVTSYFSGYFRSAAERNGYNPDIAEAFISKEKEVKIGDRMVHAKGSLLTLSAQEAARVEEGRTILAAGIAETLDEAVQKAGYSGSVRRVEPTGFEKIALWITSFASLFLLGGIIGAYIEIKTPGFGLAGMASVVCFVVFFTGHYLAGLAGWEVFAFFFIGVLLVLGELLLHPGTILPGVLGVFLILGAILWAMIDRYPSESWIPTAEMLLAPMTTLGISLLLGAIVMVALAKILPRTSLYGRLVLSASSGSMTFPGQAAEQTSMPIATPGMTGVAVTPLRPSGKAQFGELLLDVVTRGEFLETESGVRIFAVEGSRIVVDPLQS